MRRQKIANHLLLLYKRQPELLTKIAFISASRFAQYYVQKGVSNKIRISQDICLNI